VRALAADLRSFLFAEEEVDRLGVTEFDDRVRAHARSVMRSGARGYCPNRPSPQRHPTMTSQAQHCAIRARLSRGRTITRCMQAMLVAMSVR
jgi:hypothetical protein